MLKKIKKLNNMQKQLAIFIFCVVIGTLVSNWIVAKHIEQYEMIYNFFYGRLKDIHVVKTDLFEYLLINRFKLLILLWIVGFVLFANYIDYIITGFLGFSFGLVFSGTFILSGFRGYGLMLFLLMPHIIVYIPVYIYLIMKNSYFSSRLYMNRKAFRTNWNGQLVLEYVLVLALCSVFATIGTFLEAYVNPEVLKWYISLRTL